ncbi:hypothetical protein WAK64_07130 [Bacillus spongiae]|uniref:Uncharacterized protein n=1 Tax=Bacillus spongiae TaxID=2683610 RepID=A0ABU8HBX9_9BACI
MKNMMSPIHKDKRGLLKGDRKEVNISIGKIVKDEVTNLPESFILCSP